MKISEIINEQINEHIRKVKGGYRLLSHKGKNLGTFPTKAKAKKHEREVQYFKHANEGESFDGDLEEDSFDGVSQSTKQITS